MKYATKSMTMQATPTASETARISFIARLIPWAPESSSLAAWGSACARPLPAGAGFTARFDGLDLMTACPPWAGAAPPDCACFTGCNAPFDGTLCGCPPMGDSPPREGVLGGILFEGSIATRPPKASVNNRRHEKVTTQSRPLSFAT
jgi:hypothetical protein